MTLHPKDHWEIPKQTVQIAQASFPRGNVYMTMHNELGNIHADRDFEDLFPARCGQSAISPAKLALITIMQFAEASYS
jgi:transposase